MSIEEDRMRNALLALRASIEPMAKQIIHPKDNEFTRQLKIIDDALRLGAPVKELQGSYPVILYFASDRDREQLINLVAADHRMRTVKL